MEEMAMSEVTDVARVGVDTFGAADWDRFRGVVAPGAVYEEYATGRRVEGVDAIIEVNKGWKQGFPDASGTITNSLESGNTAVLEITWQGTQSGEMVTPTGQTLPPSGKPVTVKAVQLVTVEGGKVTEIRQYFDLMGLLAQIGAVPAPTSA
jgi:steroid delta-isomerase-like uncharacterized protein